MNAGPARPAAGLAPCPGHGGAGLALILALGLGLVIPACGTGQGGVGTEGRALGEFHLDTHRGTPLDRERLLGQWSLMFFGYTFCPDVCPATLAQVDRVHEVLAQTPRVATPEVILVSVDPARDSLEHLGRYVEHFNPAFTGATGETGEIRRLERQVGAYHRLGPPDGRGHYAVTHSSEVLLIDPEARVRARFQAPLQIAEVARSVQDRMQAYGNGAAR
jgi:protein SCO1/2